MIKTLVSSSFWDGDTYVCIDTTSPNEDTTSPGAKTTSFLDTTI